MWGGVISMWSCAITLVCLCFACSVVLHWGRGQATRLRQAEEVARRMQLQLKDMERKVTSKDDALSRLMQQSALSEMVLSTNPRSTVQYNTVQYSTVQDCALSRLRQQSAAGAKNRGWRRIGYRKGRNWELGATICNRLLCLFLCGGIWACAESRGAGAEICGGAEANADAAPGCQVTVARWYASDQPTDCPHSVH